MQERRFEQRLLCADVVDIEWQDAKGKTRRVPANLEDISASGACLQLDSPLPVGTLLKISHPRGKLKGVVCYCIYKEIGYFLGIEFQPETRWSPNHFRPQHLTDPRSLL